ncbi:hypothetical protein EYF80_059388 [Liparis tanakae]|uniref:Uncharacterized protein n=1 Tax=Liparis tanakae TaxID=230148 RepID=A0A4Z2ENX7_9TELE|nr:hypothetical protein EYF80_059388 [Liparis tanakae]
MSLQHGVQLVRQVVKHVADVVQNVPRRHHGAAAAANAVDQKRALPGRYEGVEDEGRYEGVEAEGRYEGVEVEGRYEGVEAEGRYEGVEAEGRYEETGAEGRYEETGAEGRYEGVEAGGAGAANTTLWTSRRFRPLGDNQEPTLRNTFPGLCDSSSLGALSSLVRGCAFSLLGDAASSGVDASLGLCRLFTVSDSFRLNSGSSGLLGVLASASAWGETAAALGRCLIVRFPSSANGRRPPEPCFGDAAALLDILSPLSSREPCEPPPLSLAASASVLSLPVLLRPATPRAGTCL